MIKGFLRGYGYEAQESGKENKQYCESMRTILAFGKQRDLEVPLVNLQK